MTSITVVILFQTSPDFKSHTTCWDLWVWTHANSGGPMLIGVVAKYLRNLTISDSSSEPMLGRRWHHLVDMVSEKW